MSRHHGLRCCSRYLKGKLNGKLMTVKTWLNSDPQRKEATPIDRSILLLSQSDKHVGLPILLDKLPVSAFQRLEVSQAVDSLDGLFHKIETTKLSLSEEPGVVEVLLSLLVVPEKLDSLPASARNGPARRHTVSPR